MEENTIIKMFVGILFLIFTIGTFVLLKPFIKGKLYRKKDFCFKMYGWMIFNLLIGYFFILSCSN